MTFSDAYAQEDRTEYEEVMGQIAEGYTISYEESADLLHEDETESVTLVVPQKPEEMGVYLDLHTDCGRIYHFL